MKFPFLIGRIKSGYLYSGSVDNTMFPFLIGRIKSKSGKYKEFYDDIKFPFLIGRIKSQAQEKQDGLILKCFHSS